MNNRHIKKVFLSALLLFTLSLTTIYVDASQNNGNSTDEELMEVCKEFEAYFLEQVFKALEKTAKVPGSEDDSSSTSSALDMFKDQMYQEYASSAVESESFGIAQMLYEQMKRNYNLD